jgi:hypothetical protein
MTAATRATTSGSSLKRYAHLLRATNNTRLTILGVIRGRWYPLTRPMEELTAIPTFEAVLAASWSVAPNKLPTRVETATETANLHHLNLVGGVYGI